MFLSRAELSTDTERNRYILASRQRLHATVLRDMQPAEGRILWRLDALAGKTYLLALSPTPPKTDAQLRWEAPKSYDALTARIAVGQQWHFRLTANPTQTHVRPGQRSKIAPCSGEEAQIDWLRRKSVGCGFVAGVDALDAQGKGIFVPSFLVQQSGTESFRRNENTKPVELTVVTYEGVLTITDTDAFRAALLGGIGRAKGYGCGLLTIVGTGK